MQFPTNKTHRPRHNRLGRGQRPAVSPVTATATPDGPRVTLQFSSAVVATGPADFVVVGRSLVEQFLESNTQIALLFSAPVETLPYSFVADTATIRTRTGAPILGMSGTFGGIMPIAINQILVSDGAGGFLGNRGTILTDGSVILADGFCMIDAAGNVTAAGFFGEGSGLTDIDYSQLVGTPPNPFNQSLNTTDAPTFSSINASSYSNLPGQASGAAGVLQISNGGGVFTSTDALRTTTDFGISVVVGKGGTTGALALHNGASSHVSILCHESQAADWAMMLPSLPGTPTQVLAIDVVSGGYTKCAWVDAASASTLATAVSDIINLSNSLISTQADVTTLQSQVAAINSILAGGVSGSLTPGTGTIDATSGIITHID